MSETASVVLSRHESDRSTKANTTGIGGRGHNVAEGIKVALFQVSAIGSSVQYLRALKIM